MHNGCTRDAQGTATLPAPDPQASRKAVKPVGEAPAADLGGGNEAGLGPVNWQWRGLLPLTLREVGELDRLPVMGHRLDGEGHNGRPRRSVTHRSEEHTS